MIGLPTQEVQLFAGLLHLRGSHEIVMQQSLIMSMNMCVLAGKYFEISNN